jgi:hypothetical protein
VNLPQNSPRHGWRGGMNFAFGVNFYYFLYYMDGAFLKLQFLGKPHFTGNLGSISQGFNFGVNSAKTANSCFHIITKIERAA